MSYDIELRPPGATIAGFPGQVRTLRAEPWPDGYLAGRTFEWHLLRVGKTTDPLVIETTVVDDTKLIADLTVPLLAGSWTLALYEVVTEDHYEARIYAPLISSRSAAEEATNITFGPITIDDGDIVFEIDVTLVEVTGGDVVTQAELDAASASLTAAISTAVTALINGAPAGGDTLGELHARLAVIEALGSLATDAELIAAVAAILGSADTDGDTLGELQALIGLRALKSQNLADLPNVATARTNLSVYSIAAVDALIAALSGTYVALADYDDADVLAKLLNVDGPGSGIDADLLDGADLSTDGTLAGNSDALVPTEKAVKTYADQLIAAADAMVFKGVIDASGNPNYPAADKGHTYRVSVAGKIGGASGPNVEVGDILLALADGVAAGNHATVGTSWSIAQTNVDGAYFAGGTDVPVADGGTGASTAAGARTNLGLVIGTDVLPVADPTATGVFTAPVVKASGEGSGGFTNPGRFLGTRTSSGPPTSGTFLTGDWGFDSDGRAWSCTAGGTPGTWIDLSSGRELGFQDVLANQTGITSTTGADITGLTTTVTTGARPVVASMYLPACYFTAGSDPLMSVAILMEDGVIIQVSRRAHAGTGTSRQHTHHIEARRSPSIGPHTYKGQLAVLSGTARLDMGAGIPGTIQVREA